MRSPSNGGAEAPRAGLALFYGRVWPGPLAAFAWAVAPRTWELPLTGTWVHLWAAAGLALIVLLWVMTARAAFHEYMWALTEVAGQRAGRRQNLQGRKNRPARTPMKHWVSRAMKTYKVTTAVYYVVAQFLTAHLLEPALALGDDAALIHGLSMAFAMSGPILVGLVHIVLDDCDRAATDIFFARRSHVASPPQSIRALDDSGLKELVGALNALVAVAVVALAVATWVSSALDTNHLAAFALFQIVIAGLQFGLLHWYLLKLFKEAKRKGSKSRRRRRLNGRPGETTAVQVEPEPVPRLRFDDTFLPGRGPPFDVA